MQEQEPMVYFLMNPVKKVTILPQIISLSGTVALFFISYKYFHCRIFFPIKKAAVLKKQALKILNYIHHSETCSIY